MATSYTTLYGPWKMQALCRDCSKTLGIGQIICPDCGKDRDYVKGRFLNREKTVSFLGLIIYNEVIDSVFEEMK